MSRTSRTKHPPPTSTEKSKSSHHEHTRRLPKKQEKGYLAQENVPALPIPLVSFPESVNPELGLKVYTPLSRETQLAVLSQFLHNGGFSGNDPMDTQRRNEIVDAVRTFLASKPSDSVPEWSDADLLHVMEDPAGQGIFNDFFDVPFPDPVHPNFTFIDLFAGMGGFRIAMQTHGGKCVFSSEWNKFAQQTYFANFGEMPFGDITKDLTKQYIPAQFEKRRLHDVEDFEFHQKAA